MGVESCGNRSAGKRKTSSCSVGLFETTAINLVNEQGRRSYTELSGCEASGDGLQFGYTIKPRVPTKQSG